MQVYDDEKPKQGATRDFVQQINRGRVCLIRPRKADNSNLGGEMQIRGEGGGSVLDKSGAIPLLSEIRSWA